MRVLSLGAGVDSSTLFLMAAAGEIPPYDLTVFADTQGEPRKVYAYLDYLKTQGEIHTVTAGDLRADARAFLKGEKKTGVSLPLFAPGRGMVRRQCTREYKVRPIRRYIRAEMKRRGETSIDLHIGISMGEFQRMRTSDVKYIRNHYPLIDMGMYKADCLGWIRRNGHPEPSKSSCTFCPFHGDAFWRDLLRDSPDEFAEVVQLDNDLRQLPTMDSETFIHHSRKPLELLPFGNQDDLFGDECSGVCGV